MSYSCGHDLVSAFNYVAMYPWISIAAGILGYITAMRVMCR
jgi:hypothetical protein